MTCSTCSSLIGRPVDQGAAANFETMSGDTLNCSATCVIVPPSAHRNTIRDRVANACAGFRRRSQPARIHAPRRSEPPDQASDSASTN